MIFSLITRFQCFYPFNLQYSAEELGGVGDGGEYEVQTGFGWSNGVILEFLARNGDVLSSTAGF